VKNLENFGMQENFGMKELAQKLIDFGISNCGGMLVKCTLISPKIYTYKPEN